MDKVSQGGLNRQYSSIVQCSLSLQRLQATVVQKCFPHKILKPANWQKLVRHIWHCNEKFACQS